MRSLAILGALPARMTIAAVLLVLLTAGCGINGLSFVQDERIDIIRPSDRSEVNLPVTVDWTATDFATGPGRGAFGVLVDRAPQRPGQTLAWLFRGDDSCKGPSGRALCATPEFLAERGAYTTTDTTFTFERIARLSGDDRRRQFHEVTVVLLDGDGHRIGESAWSVQFELPRQP